MLSQLRVAVGRAHTVLAAPTWRAAEEILRHQPVDIIVVDPCADGTAQTDTVRAMRVGYPSVAMLVYTGITAESTRAMLMLGEFGVRHCVLRGFDDEPGRFRERLEVLRASGLEDRILAALGVALAGGQAPPRLVGAIDRLFRSPVRFRTAEDVAAAAGMPRRAVNRWLERAGLAPARVLVLAARVLRGYQYGQNPALTMTDIAGRLGYPDPRVFADHIRSMTGHRASAWRSVLTPDEAVAVLVAKLRGAKLPVAARCDTAAPPALTLLRRAAGHR
jgi:AraC-like DNA-binding protein